MADDFIESLILLFALLAFGYWLVYLPLYAVDLVHATREDPAPAKRFPPLTPLIVGAFVVQLVLALLAWNIRLFPAEKEETRNLLQLLYSDEGSVLLTVGLVMNCVLGLRAAKVLFPGAKGLRWTAWIVLPIGLLVAVGQLHYASLRSPFPNEEVRLKWLLVLLFLISVWLLLFRPIVKNRPPTVQGALFNRISRTFCIFWGLSFILIPTF